MEVGFWIWYHFLKVIIALPESWKVLYWADLIFGSNSELRASCQVYGCADSRKFETILLKLGTKLSLDLIYGRKRMEY
jgi:hypothetical protein